LVLIAWNIPPSGGLAKPGSCWPRWLPWLHLPSGTAPSRSATQPHAAGTAISKSELGNGTVVDSTDTWRISDKMRTPDNRHVPEGVRNEQQFSDVERVAARKPVLVWKVGQTEDGARAGLAHRQVPIQLRSGGQGRCVWRHQVESWMDLIPRELARLQHRLRGALIPFRWTPDKSPTHSGVTSACRITQAPLLRSPRIAIPGAEVSRILLGTQRPW
jgi:hypothetical protein